VYLYWQSNYHGAMLCHVGSHDPARHVRVCLQRFLRIRPATITALPAQPKDSIEKFEEPNAAAKPRGTRRSWPNRIRNRPRSPERPVRRWRPSRRITRAVVPRPATARRHAAGPHAMEPLRASSRPCRVIRHALEPPPAKDNQLCRTSTCDGTASCGASTTCQGQSTCPVRYLAMVR